jgi:prepilin-type N-terminal cleavage/methylation domain-containing protein
MKNMKNIKNMKYAKPSRDFTLIELLVVVAIIGILLSILLPKLLQAREITLEAVCMSNRSQSINGVALYAKNQNASFPASRGRPWRLEYTIKRGSYHLLGRTYEYVGDQVLACPTKTSTRYAGPSENARGMQRRWLSYNCAIWRHRSRNIPQTFHSTEEKAILGDLIQNADTLGSDHKRKVKMIAYIDGSVKRLDEEELKVMKTLQGIPRKGQYKPFWDSINDID